jgi:hypothetical protein
MTGGTDRRGQVFTLEGVFAALVILAGLVFALQAVVLTPSVSGGDTTGFDDARVGSVLETAGERDALRESLLFWNATVFERGDRAFVAGFYNSSENRTFYTGTEFNESQGRLAAMLDRSFGESVSANVVVTYRNESGAPNGTFPMVLNGAPGSNAARASTTVTLYDSDRLVENATTGARTTRTVEAAEGESDLAFYAPDAYPESDLYNVLEVEVVVWRN